MEYQFVTADEQIQMRKSWLRTLELDHITASLAWEEAPNDKQRQDDMAMFEQRIRYHRRALANMTAQPEEEANSGGDANKSGG